MAIGLSPENNEIFRRYNYRIHTAIDMLKVGMVLEDMVKSGHMDANVATTYEHLASALLTSLSNENYRAFGLKPHVPIR